MALLKAQKRGVYSVHEVEIGIWIDGKTIYRKVFYIDVLDLENGVYSQDPGQGTNLAGEIYHNISIEKYLRTDIVKTNLNSDVPTCFPLAVFSIDAGTNVVQGTGIFSSGINYAPNYMQIGQYVNQHLYPEFYLIVEYTKVN